MPSNGQPVDVAWTWGSILTLAFTTGLVTAIFNQGFSWLKEAWQRQRKDRRSGRVLALSLMELLTRYAQECNSGARRNRLVAEEGGVGRLKLPVLPPYPDCDGWGALPTELAARLQDLRNEADEAVRGIAETDHVLGPPEAFESATLLQVDLGYIAWDLAKRLRRYYGLGRYAGNPLSVWN
jgi:hypothetical protein